MSSGVIWAECTTMPPRVFTYPPPGSDVPTNVRFVLEGEGAGSEVVEKLRKAVSYLESENDRVVLVPKKFGESGVDGFTIVLQPSRFLKPGRFYRFGSRDLSGSELGLFRGSGAEGDGRVAWKTTEGPDLDPPRWSGVPRVDSVIHEPFGCRDEIGATILAKMWDGSYALVLVKLNENDKPAKPSSNIVHPSEGRIYVGQTMCDGTFWMNLASRYEAELIAIDAAGNEASAPGGPIEFTTPSREGDTRESSVKTRWRYMLDILLGR